MFIYRTNRILSVALGLCAAGVLSAAEVATPLNVDELNTAWTSFLTSCQNNPILASLMADGEHLKKVYQVRQEITDFERESWKAQNCQNELPRLKQQLQETKEDQEYYRPKTKEEAKEEWRQERMADIQKDIDQLTSDIKRAEDIIERYQQQREALNQELEGHQRAFAAKYTTADEFSNIFVAAMKTHLQKLPRSAVLDVVERDILASSRTPNAAEQGPVQELVQVLRSHGIVVEQVRIFDGESLYLALPTCFPNTSEDFKNQQEDENFANREFDFMFNDYTEEFSFRPRQFLQRGCKESPVCRDIAILYSDMSRSEIPFTERLDWFCTTGFYADDVHQFHFFHDANSESSCVSGRDIFVQETSSDQKEYPTLLTNEDDPWSGPQQLGWARADSWFIIFHELGHVLDKVRALNLFGQDLTMEKLAPLMQTVKLSQDVEYMCQTVEGLESIIQALKDKESSVYGHQIPARNIFASWQRAFTKRLNDIQNGRCKIETLAADLEKTVQPFFTKHFWTNSKEFWNMVGLALVNINGKLTLCVNKLSEWAIFIQKGWPTRCSHVSARDFFEFLNYLTKITRHESLYQILIKLYGKNYETYRQEVQEQKGF